MIDKLTANLPGFSMDAFLDRIKSPAPDDATLEIAFDQHYGLRIIPREQWTEIQFREGGSWTHPEDSREFIRRMLRQK